MYLFISRRWVICVYPLCILLEEGNIQSQIFYNRGLVYSMKILHNKIFRSSKLEWELFKKWRFCARVVPPRLKDYMGRALCFVFNHWTLIFFTRNWQKEFFKLFVTHYFSCLDKKFDRSKKSTINSGLKFSKEERALTAWKLQR